jgi:hypothetical protein
MRLVKSGIDTVPASHGVLDSQTLDGPMLPTSTIYSQAKCPIAQLKVKSVTGSIKWYKYLF